MQVRVAEFNMHVFPPKFCSNYAILIFLKGDDENFTLL